MHTSFLTRFDESESLHRVTSGGGFDGGCGFRGWRVWRPAVGKRGALLHEALVERSSPRIRRLAGNPAREVPFHRVLRTPEASCADMAAWVGSPPARLS